MPKVIPNRPDTTERAGPEAGRGGMGDLTVPFLDALDPLGADPRQWRADPAGVAAASAALRDPHARAVLDQRLDAGVAAPLAVEPGGARRRDRMAAESLRAQLDAIETDRVCRELAHAVWYGYAVAECLWATDGGQVVLADLRVRDPARFRFRADGAPLLVTRDAPRGVELPPAKFVVLRQPRQHGGQPHGPGAGSWCVWPVWLKRQALRMWSVALEKFGAPTLVGIVRRDASDGEIERMLRTQRAIATGVGVTLPEGQRLELLDTARRSGGDYGAFITALDGMMADAVLGQRATSEIGPWRGTAEVQAQVLERLVAADARRLNAALQHTVATWLTQWNHPGAAVPVLSRDLSPPEDLLARAQRDEIVARTTGLRPTQGAVEQTYGGEWEAAPGAPDPPEPPPARARTAGGESLSATFAAGDAAGPVPALVAQARGVLGPRVDAWTDRLRATVVQTADSLAAVAQGMEAQAVDALDVSGVVERLAQALLAAHLAGRYDIEATPVEGARARDGVIAFASAAALHTQLPFAEQIDFFRSKLSLPTRAWTDLWQTQHDVAFVVAGAARDDLVSDLRGAVDQAIAEGTTLATFRRDFDSIVAKHGWSYNGGRDWRTRVIYETNLRTSYAAGRYQQLKDGAERRPYWRYRHSEASEHPRHDHLAWDGLVLRHDDPWWDTHYPPNGWGCQCFVEALNARDLKRLGKSGPDTAPPIRTRTVTVGAQGPSPRTVTVPEGIDPGWAYAPGQAAALGPATRRYLQSSARRAPGVAAAGAAATLARESVRQALGNEWRRWRRESAGRGRQAEAFELGALAPEVVMALRRRGTAPVSATVTMTRRALTHAMRPAKRGRGAALDDADLDRLTDIIAEPEAVLLDARDTPTALLYVFTPHAAPGKGKVVVRVDYADRLRIGDAPRQMVTTNTARTAGYVDATNLREQRYEVLTGSVE